mgnify:FL=1
MRPHVAQDLALHEAPCCTRPHVHEVRCCTSSHVAQDLVLHKDHRCTRPPLHWSHRSLHKGTPSHEDPGFLPRPPLARPPGAHDGHTALHEGVLHTEGRCTPPPHALHEGCRATAAALHTIARCKSPPACIARGLPCKEGRRAKHAVQMSVRCTALRVAQACCCTSVCSMQRRAMHKSLRAKQHRALHKCFLARPRALHKCLVAQVPCTRPSFHTRVAHVCRAMRESFTISVQSGDPNEGTPKRGTP